MDIDASVIIDPEPAGPPVEDLRSPGHWYPIELRILADGYRRLGAAELSRDWIPEHSPAQIEAKARELGLT